MVSTFQCGLNKTRNDFSFILPPFVNSCNDGSDEKSYYFCHELTAFWGCIVSLFLAIKQTTWLAS